MDGQMLDAEPLMPPNDEEPQRLADEQAQRVEQLLQTIQARRKLAMDAKRAIEQRIIEDMRQKNGNDRELPATKAVQSLPSDKKNVIPPQLNLTRNRANTVSARLCDSAFPDNDTPWSLEPPSAVDEIDPSLMVGDDGQPIPREQWPQVANERCGTHSELIASQLKAFAFSSKGRQFVDHLVDLGTGIFCGPYPRRFGKRVWKSSTVADPVTGKTRRVQTSEMKYEIRPEFELVHPLEAYPESGDHISVVEGMHRVLMLSEAQLREGVEAQGWNKEAVDELIAMGPQTSADIYSIMTGRNSALGLTDDYSKKFAVWRFDGALNKEDAQALGAVDDACECPRLMCELWECQGKALKCKTDVIENSLELPYFTVPFEKIDDSLFGVGVPYLYRDTQRTINSMWAAAQYNTAVSAGFQMLMRKGLITPLDGSFEIRGPKIWTAASDYRGPLKDAMDAFNLPNNAEEALAIMEKAIVWGDEAISLPMFSAGANAPGQAGAAQQTSSGYAMFMNTQNITQKALGQRLDDDLFKPAVGRLGAYNLQDTTKDRGVSILCDFEVTSNVQGNLIRDVQAQHLIAVKQMVDADPELKPYLKPYAWLMNINRCTGMAPSDIWRSEEEVAKILAEQSQQQPGDPMVALKAQELELKKAEGERNAAQAAEDRKLDHVEKMRELDIRQQEAESREYVADKQLQGDMIRAEKELEIKATDASTKRMKAAGDLRIKAEDTALKSQEAKIVTGVIDKKQQGY